VVTLIEGPRFGLSCLFGLPHCSDDALCPLHPVWGEIRRQILSVLNGHTLADLANRTVTLAVATRRTT
jgi:DNA-binding IscR family transcriptional regulator